MDDRLRLRVRESPTGGSRIAFGYLGTLLGLVLLGLLLVVVSPLAPVVCGQVDDIYCIVGWTAAVSLVGLVLCLALVAAILRLGWEWWVLAAGVVVLAPLALDVLPQPLVVVGGILTPGLAGVATWTGPERPRWRPLLIGGVGIAALAVGAAAILW